MSIVLQEGQAKSPEQGAKGEPKAVKKGADKAQQQQQAGSPAAPSRPEELPKGIAGAAVPRDGIADVKRMVPDGEPGALPLNADLAWIGKRVPRVDGPAKTTGRARYTADVYLPGMLYAVMVDSRLPHARIRNIDTSAAARAPGVKGVYILKHLTGGIAELKDPALDPASKYPIVRFAGQPILGVAAATQAQARDAAKLVKIDYDPIPFVATLEQAKQPNSPPVYPGVAASAGSAGGGGGAHNVPQKNNVRGPALGPRGAEKGSTELGFKSAADGGGAIVESTYRTQVQTQSALETHGVVADWKPELLTVYASTQGTASVRDEMAEYFEIPKSQVRVITEFMGGGFGAKFGAGNCGVIATGLSKQIGKPVKLMLDRRQEHLVAMRPDSEQHLKIGAGKDGIITAMHLVSYGTAGVGTGAGTAGPVQNLYKCDNVLTEEYDVFTNTGPGAAMRAPGHPQGAFALEQAIDEMAVKLNMDPLEFRDKNDEQPARREERRIGAQLAGWSNRKPAGSDSGSIKRGLGMAQGVWYRIVSMDSNAEVRISRDGAVEVLSGVQDIGGGIRTIMSQVVAEELGLDPRQVTVKIGDTNYPQGPNSGGSTTTGSITPAVRDAAFKARTQLARQVAPALGAHPEDLVFSRGQIGVKGGKSMAFKSAVARMNTDEISARAARSRDYADAEGTGSKTKSERITYGGVHFAQVAVDTGTGVVRVEKFWAIQDCGRPMNPLYLESQINGGVIQGISYALWEDRIIDPNSGIMLNPNLEEYKILGSKDVPEIHVHIIQNYLGLSSTDAGGIGEPSKVPAAAAVANAVYNAIGARVYELPIRPAVVLAALNNKTQGANA
ncbi:MAG: xanthine dehydrogenase family protein molybdopterin-binding subunit [Acidobacteriaceae bacterium]